MKNLRVLVLSLTLAVVLAACSDPEDNFAGSEYMPDMAHSLALEANTYNYYYYNTWDDESTVELAKLVYPRVTVKGAVPRGYAGSYLNDRRTPARVDSLGNPLAEDMVATPAPGEAEMMNAIAVPVNGHVPYYYEDSPEGRLDAIANLQDNPFPITEEGMIRGAKLYNIFCSICHGAQGNGLGYIYDEDQNPNAAYPLAPANFLTDEFKAASNGRYYHAIYYGYNAMGAYKDKMNYEERWQVIHYIRSLQAKDANAEYAEDVNTFNEQFGIPMRQYSYLSQDRLDPDVPEYEGASGGESQSGPLKK